MKEITVFVVCYDSNGKPSIVVTHVSATSAAVDQGEQYVRAKAKAGNAGYEGPMICIDWLEAPPYLKTAYEADEVVTV